MLSLRNAVERREMFEYSFDNYRLQEAIDKTHEAMKTWRSQSVEYSTLQTHLFELIAVQQFRALKEGEEEKET